MARNLDELREVNARIVEQELELARLIDEASYAEILTTLLIAEREIDKMARILILTGHEQARMQLVKSCWAYWSIISRTLLNEEEKLENAG